MAQLQLQPPIRRPGLPHDPRRNYDSMHLLGATTLTTDPSSRLWYMDSAASLHCNFDILDIVDPVPLPEPLPIGNAVTLQYVLSTYCRSLRPFHS